MNQVTLKKNCNDYEGIIFDLDGTLLNTEEGVLSSVRYATEQMGYSPLTDEVLKNTFIGPPVKRALMAAYHISDQEADKATELFRNRYKNYDLLKAIPYEGVIPLIHDLKKRGFKIGVATLKREDYAITILEHFHIAEYCDAICGSDFASKMLKADVLRNCLNQLTLSPKEAILIGDTASDGTGANAVGVDLIAVTYGFGFHTEEERNRFSPVFTAHTVEELRSFLYI